MGRTINQYVNLKGGYNATFWAGYQAKIPKTDLNGKININGNLNHAPNIFNGQEGITNSYGFTFTPGLNYNKEEVMFASLDIGLMYNDSRSTINTTRNIQFFSFVPSASVTYYLPLGMEISTDAD